MDAGKREVHVRDHWKLRGAARHRIIAEVGDDTAVHQIEVERANEAEEAPAEAVEDHYGDPPAAKCTRADDHTSKSALRRLRTGVLSRFAHRYHTWIARRTPVALCLTRSSDAVRNPERLR